MFMLSILREKALTQMPVGSVQNFHETKLGNNQTITLPHALKAVNESVSVLDRLEVVLRQEIHGKRSRTI